jgi:virulence-associated protein VapD
MKPPKNKLAVRAINFDLDTNAIKDLIAAGTVDFSSVTTAYARIKKSMKKSQFAHRQGSGYLSKRALEFQSAILAVNDLGLANPWLADCVRVCDLTSFDGGSQPIRDVVPVIRAAAEAARGSEPPEKAPPMEQPINPKTPEERIVYEAFHRRIAESERRNVASGIRPDDAYTQARRESRDYFYDGAEAKQNAHAAVLADRQRQAAFMAQKTQKRSSQSKAQSQSGNGR